jgi:ribosomal protein S11
MTYQKNKKLKGNNYDTADGIIHVNITKNNTLLTLTDNNGDVLT